MVLFTHAPGSAPLLGPLIAAVLIAVTCAALGVYVVLRRMAFVGDALAHTVLPGLVLAVMFGWNLFAGALAAGIVTAFGIGWLSRRQRLREDTAIGVLFTAMFAFGILLAARRGDPEELFHLLLGRLSDLQVDDLYLIGGIAVVVLASLAAMHKELELASFDPTFAEAIGIKVDRLRYALLILLALTVVAAIQAVGVLMTTALLVTPAAAASLLTDRLPSMMGLAAAIAVFSSLAGYMGAGTVGVAAGPAIVLMCTACFAVAWAIHEIRRRA